MTDDYALASELKQREAAGEEIPAKCLRRQLLISYIQTESHIMSYTLLETIFHCLAYCACQHDCLRSWCMRICCIVVLFKSFFESSSFPFKNCSVHTDWHAHSMLVLTDLAKSFGCISLCWHMHLAVFTAHIHKQAHGHVPFLFSMECVVFDGFWMTGNPCRWQ